MISSVYQCASCSPRKCVKAVSGYVTYPAAWKDAPFLSLVLERLNDEDLLREEPGRDRGCYVLVPGYSMLDKLTRLWTHTALSVLRRGHMTPPNNAPVLLLKWPKKSLERRDFTLKVYSVIVFHSNKNVSLSHGSSIGGPGPLGGHQRYYRGSSKSLSDTNFFYNNHLNTTVHIRRTLA